MLGALARTGIRTKKRERLGRVPRATDAAFFRPDFWPDFPSRDEPRVA